MCLSAWPLRSWLATLVGCDGEMVICFRLFEVVGIHPQWGPPLFCITSCPNWAGLCLNVVREAVDSCFYGDEFGGTARPGYKRVACGL